MTTGPSPDDTIAALATPLGEAGLAVIRISGREALAIASRVFTPAGRSSKGPADAPSHTVHYGHIVREGRRIDEVLLTVLRAPRTFTREDTVEISCHGGGVVTHQVLEAVLAGGARLALPGEFTQRAFLNGRIDLSQAEAVADLIHARTHLAAAAALEQLEGRLSQCIRTVRDDLMNLLAHIEAHIDFPEEDIAPDTREKLLRRLQLAADQVATLKRTAPEGQILRRGVRAAIVGRPNAGKSSLLNLLLGRDRAIVSPTPGTTRDTVEETADVRGIPVVFIDTAGMRETTDHIEAEGVRRSLAAAESAELILHVIDGSLPVSEDDRSLLGRWPASRTLRILNKSDLGRQARLPDGMEVVELSATRADGLETLKDAIGRIVWSGKIPGENLPLTVNARQADALGRSGDGLLRAASLLESDGSLELVALEVRIGVGALGEVAGQTTTEDLLDSIFRQFCLGK